MSISFVTRLIVDCCRKFVAIAATIFCRFTDRAPPLSADSRQSASSCATAEDGSGRSSGPAGTSDVEETSRT